MTQIKLSAVIITLNEEKNIARCLDSLQGVADEIVVIDSFSTDDTEKICSAYGVRFIQHPFDGYIEQKNYGIQQAVYTHILSLDADEALSDELKQSIGHFKMHWHADGYSLNRLTNYCGHWIYHCGWYPDTKLRLWDKRYGQWAGENGMDALPMPDCGNCACKYTSSKPGDSVDFPSCYGRTSNDDVAAVREQAVVGVDALALKPGICLQPSQNASDKPACSSDRYSRISGKPNDKTHGKQC